MRGLLSVLIVLVVVCPVYADTVVFSEDFSTGTVGDPVSGWNGWTGETGIVISSTVRDQGNSAGYAGTAWPGISHTFVNTPAAGDKYVFSATLCAGSSTGYADLVLRTSSGTSPRAVAYLYNGDLAFSAGYDEAVFAQDINPDMSKAIDVKLELEDVAGEVRGYWRYNGDPGWTLAGSTEAVIPLADFSVVRSCINGSGGVGLDSVLLTEVTIPEPASCILLAIGTFSLLAYAWRKRK